MNLSTSLTPHHMGPRARPPPIINFASLAHRRRHSQPSPPTEFSSTYRTRSEREIDRDLNPGEEMRVSVVIQMPREKTDRKIDDETVREDEVGWENGMQLGVWEGILNCSQYGYQEHHRYPRASWGGEGGG